MELFRILLMVALSIPLAASQTQKKDDYEFEGNQFRREEKTADGKTLGEYGYRTPDGCVHVVKYEADQKGGYKVLGSSKRGCNRQITRPTTTTKRPSFIAATTRPTTTRRPITTTRRPITTTRRPITITRRPITTTRRPITTTRRPITTTRRPITTTRRPITTTRRPIFTTRRTTTPSRTTTTTTTPRPKDQLSAINPLPQVANSIEGAETAQGRQLRQPNLTTQRPSTTTTPKPEEEPTYTYGYTTPTHGHTESGLPNGGKKGEYFWDGPDGYRRIVTYVANERGFFPRMRTIRIPTTTPKPPPGSDPEGEAVAKELAGPDKEEVIAVPVGGCPYYFYYNTRINYHWERCHENGNRTGEFGQLASDGYSHKTSYYADSTGFHPKISRTRLTARQAEVVAEFTKGAFIIPKPDEERQETDRRIQDWISENQDRVDEPLR